MQSLALHLKNAESRRTPDGFSSARECLENLKISVGRLVVSRRELHHEIEIRISMEALGICVRDIVGIPAPGLDRSGKGSLLRKRQELVERNFHSGGSMNDPPEYVNHSFASYPIVCIANSF